MDLGLLSPSILVVLSSVLTLVGYVLFYALDNGTLRQQSKRTSRYLIFLCYNCNEFLVVLSSVLMLVGYVLFDALDSGSLRQQKKKK